MWRDRGNKERKDWAISHSLKEKGRSLVRNIGLRLCKEGISIVKERTPRKPRQWEQVKKQILSSWCGEMLLISIQNNGKRERNQGATGRKKDLIFHKSGGGKGLLTGSGKEGGQTERSGETTRPGNSSPAVSRGGGSMLKKRPGTLVTC